MWKFFKGNGEKHIPRTEFKQNNYQKKNASIKLFSKDNRKQMRNLRRIQKLLPERNQIVTY
jgi:hypothetical protein